MRNAISRQLPSRDGPTSLLISQGHQRCSRCPCATKGSRALPLLGIDRARVNTWRRPVTEREREREREREVFPDALFHGAMAYRHAHGGPGMNLTCQVARVQSVATANTTYRKRCRMRCEESRTARTGNACLTVPDRSKTPRHCAVDAILHHATRSCSRPLRHRIQGSHGESHDRAIHLARIPRAAQARVDCRPASAWTVRNRGLPRSFRWADTAYAADDLGLYAPQREWIDRTLELGRI
jgi:hypothetical protein